MPKPELGVRRRCLTCQAAFFDLNRTPINCVKCGAVFNVVELPRSPPRRAPVRLNSEASPIPVPGAEADLVTADGEAGDEAGDEAGEESTLPPPDEDDDDDSLEGIINIAPDDKDAVH